MVEPLSYPAAARAATRAVVGVLAALALLPPVLLGLAMVWAGAASMLTLAACVLATALASSAAALAVWWWVVRMPVARLAQAERRVQLNARLDALTGLLNREGLGACIAEVLQRHGAAAPKLGLLMVDMDRFNLVNATLGQAGGDEVLQLAARRLRQVVRAGDVLSRPAGDQFVVLLEGIGSAAMLEAAARNLLRAFEDPVRVRGQEVHLALSIGGVLAGQKAPNGDALLRQAMAAMRATKAAGGRGFSLFEPAMDERAEQRMEFDLKLRRALACGQFFLLYQPIVDARSQRIVAVEALLRWASPERGLVSPADFVPVLEESGLIVPVGYWVLQEACRQAVAWRREGAPQMLVSVNISPRQFNEGDFVERVRAIVERSGLPLGSLQLEVTEGLLLEPTPATLARIHALTALGIRLAVDDFGMGYSSLAYLKRFPLHALKIDRVFVSEVAQRAQDLAIVQAIVNLGHSLGLGVTAEGVETEAQAHALAGIGCDALQGFLFSRPASGDALAAALTGAVQALPVLAPVAPNLRRGDAVATVGEAAAA